MYIQRLAHVPNSGSSIIVRQDCAPQNHNVWHSHEELEFIYIKEGKGTFFVGDCIQHFSDEFMVLIGSNTPHYWLFDEEYLQKKEADIADIRVVHFPAEFMGSDFFQLPESALIKQVYQQAQRALTFSPADPCLARFFTELPQQSPLQRLTSLVHALDYIANRPALSPLVSNSYTNPQQQEDHRRMNRVLEHIRLRYKSKIHLEEIAHLADMTPNSFCRYFKQRTGKTFVQFLNEIRIGHACKLLSESSSPIKEICFDCGFQNFVSFHKLFKQQTQMTPAAYRMAAPVQLP